MTATAAADAPLQDITFVQEMMKYEAIDPEVALAVQRKLQNHGWYLTQELIPFALFSTKVSNSQKRSMADQLCTVEKPQNFRVGKPVFPKIAENTTLADLIGPESHFIFAALDIGMEWLRLPVETRPQNEYYKTAYNFVTTLKVVNDIAERGVKMMADFANTITTNAELRQHLLQAVEYNRQQFDNFKKRTLNQ